MPSIYQLGNIAVLPSMWEEPAGMTMVEAVVSGLPLITTNSGGIPEYISDDVAVLLDRDENLVDNKRYYRKDQRASDGVRLHKKKQR